MYLRIFIFALACTFINCSANVCIPTFQYLDSNHSVWLDPARFLVTITQNCDTGHTNPCWATRFSNQPCNDIGCIDD